MVALINKVDGHCHEVVAPSVLTQHFLRTGALRKPEWGTYPFCHVLFQLEFVRASFNNGH